MSDNSTEPGATASAIKASEQPAYPEHLLIEQPPYRPGVSRIAVDRYFKQEYHDLEVERIWKKAWQWACREEDIPEIGDYIVYEVADLSMIVVRTGEHDFRSYWNACLHRGRKLCDFDGKRATEFRCMFHGWAWDINGKMTDMTCGWDFPGVRDEVSKLPEVRTGAWGGWVFVNPDPNCEPLDSYLGTLPDHFEGAGHDLGKRWKQVHVVADVKANWKVVQEAFLEAWHVTHTHPQMVMAGERSKAGLRWDDFGNWMRGAPALPTDKHRSPGTWSLVAEHEQQIVDQYYDQHLNEDDRLELGPGNNATAVIINNLKEKLRKTLGDSIDHFHTVHLGGGEMVSVFPNFHPWAGFSRIVYRFRPYKNDPERSLMDVQLLAPWPDDVPRPPPAPAHHLGLGEDIGEAPELGSLARVFAQDLANVPHVQAGLKTTRSGYVLLSSHNEAPVRKFHDMYDKWMGFEDGDYLARKTGR